MKKVTKYLIAVVLCWFFSLPASPAFARSFPDIRGHWAQTFIEKLTETGTIKGYPDGLFRTENQVTRAEFITMLVKSINLPLLSPATVTFTDVPATSWSYPFIETAASAGIIKGYQGKFDPDAQISRNEIAVMLTRALNLGAQAEARNNQPAVFSDADKSPEWARGYISQAAELGLIKGYPGGTVRGNNLASRAESAVMMVKLLDLINQVLAPPQPVKAFYDSKKSELQLTFNKEVKTSSADVTKIGFQFNDDNQVYLLSKASKVAAAGETSPTLVIKVEGMPDLTNVSILHAWLKPGTVTGLNDVPNLLSKIAVEFTRIQVPPRPTSALYDSDKAELKLTFDRTIKGNSIDVTKIGFQFNNENSVYFITSDSKLLTLSDSSSIAVKIVGMPDLTNIDALNVWLKPGTVVDLNGIPNVLSCIAVQFTRPGRNPLQPGTETPLDGITAPINSVLKGTGNMLEGVTNTAASVLQPVAGAVNQALQPVTETVEAILQPVTGTLGKTVQSVTTTANQLLQPITGTLGSILQPVTGTLSPVLQPVTGAVNQVLQPATKPLATALQPVTETLSPVLQPVADAVNQVLQPIAGPVLQPVTETINRIVQPAADTQSQQATADATGILQPITGILGTVAGTVGSLPLIESTLQGIIGKLPLLGSIQNSTGTSGTSANMQTGVLGGLLGGLLKK